MPAPVFVVLRCGRCQRTLALVRDPATGNRHYYDAASPPAWPPMFVASGSLGQTCPGCGERAELLSTAAVVTSGGKWLFIDKRGVAKG